MHQFAVEFILHATATTKISLTLELCVPDFHERLSIYIYFFISSLSQTNYLFLNLSLQRKYVNWVFFRIRFSFDTAVKYSGMKLKIDNFSHRCYSKKKWSQNILLQSEKPTAKFPNTTKWLLTLFTFSGYRFRTHCFILQFN